MATYFDDFNRANNADLGADWTVQFGAVNCQIVGNRVRAGATGSARVEQNSFALTNDQWAQVTFPTLNAVAITAGVIVRAAAAGTQTYYAGHVTKIGAATTTVIQRTVSTLSPVESDLITNTALTWAANDVLRLEAIGENIIMRQNGAVVLSANDSFIASGKAGIFIFASVLTDVELDDFRAGDSRQWLFGAHQT